MTQQIAFLGAGNMAGALISGLIADGMPAGRLLASDPDAAKCADLAAATGIRIAQDNDAAVRVADVVVLAVKPQVLRRVAEGIADAVQTHRPLVVSIAAGIRCPDLDRWLGGDVALIRTMPNTPAMLQAGATALYATPGVSPRQRELAESLMRAVGLTQWIDEEQQMDAVTALSGSGPAYFFLVIEAMQAAGRALGLADETARLLTLQTALGAARMALESDEGADMLRQRVTSPGGTTERAIGLLEDGGLRALFERAMRGACDRSVELSADLGAE